MDAYGDDEHTAMARLVSIPVSYAVEAVMAGEIAPGVHAAPKAKAAEWIEKLKSRGEEMNIVNHLA